MSNVMPLNNVVAHKLGTVKWMLDELYKSDGEAFMYVNKAYDEITELLEYLYIYEPLDNRIMKLIEIKNYFDAAFEKESSEPLDNAYNAILKLLEL